MNLRAVWADDKRHIIIGIANVDDQIKREHEHARKLRQAHDRAMKDELTGVRNKNAYTEYEAKLEADIQSGTQGPFGIVVCDVNGLKIVNDTLGHKAGDAYIQQACMLICTIYAHSPVFRVGGDEFVVVLQGQDFTNRDALLDIIRTDVLRNQEEGSVIVATGMSVFDKESDRSTADVFARADELMYENKKTLKGARE